MASYLNNGSKKLDSFDIKRLRKKIGKFIEDEKEKQYHPNAHIMRGHHLLPSSRGGKGKNNISPKRESKHKAWHGIFTHLTAHEVIDYINKLDKKHPELLRKNDLNEDDFIQLTIKYWGEIEDKYYLEFFTRTFIDFSRQLIQIYYAKQRLWGQKNPEEIIKDIKINWTHN